MNEQNLFTQGSNSPPVSVTPVLHLALDALTLQPGGKASDLAEEIRQHAPEAGYQKSSSGWFVPLGDLVGKLPGLAECLYEQTTYASQFEIGGGLDIRLGTMRLGVFPGSNFRLAMGLIQAILNLQEGSPPRRIFVAPHQPWLLAQENGLVHLEIDPVNYDIPFEPFRQGLLAAQDEIRQFAGRIEPLMLSFHDQWITAETVRSVFGLKPVR